MTTVVKSPKNRIILGLMTFGPAIRWGAKITSLDEFGQSLDFFQEQGYDEVDIARMYQHGAQEAFTAAVGWRKRGLNLAAKKHIGNCTQPFQGCIAPKT